VRLPIEEQLQPVLGLAEEPVGICQDVDLLARQATGDFEGFERRERVPLPYGWQVAAVQQLQELHGVFDVADAAAAGLHVVVVGPRGGRPVLHAALERLHLVDLGETEVLAIDERLDGPDELPAEGQIAGRGADLDERLPFPGSAHRVVVGERSGEAAGQRPALPARAKPQIDR